MHRFCSLDFTVQEAKSATVRAVSAATLYGKGVFTTVRIRNGRPFLWEKHWRRLCRDAEKCGINFSIVSEARTISALEDLLTANQIAEARARITIFDLSGGFWANGKANISPQILITTAALRTVPPVFRLTFSPFPINSVSPLAGVKSCNYLENLIVLEEAKKRGFDEAIRLNEKGEIVSAAMANLFWLSDGKLFTPPVSAGCVGGTIREYIIDNNRVTEKSARPEDIKTAEKLFLSSSGIGIVEVAELDGNSFASGDFPLKGLLEQLENAACY